MDDVVERLSEQLPLRDRQASLPPVIRAFHREILSSYADRGKPPDDALSPAGALSRLVSDDLIVLEEGRILGAYPFSSEPTAHRLLIEGNAAFAMCSVDAVAVAPVFSKRVVIKSSCAVTGSPVTIVQNGDEVEGFEPSGLRLGVRWQKPDGCAAHSMCREMVFLRDGEVARRWRSPREPASVFALEEGIVFGTRFFSPLMDPDGSSLQPS